MNIRTSVTLAIALLLLAGTGTAFGNNHQYSGELYMKGPEAAPRKTHNLVQMYRRACKRYKANPLFIKRVGDKWQKTTYGEFKQKVDKVRAGLAAMGVGKGDKVAVIAPNQEEVATTFYAAAGLGAVFVPMFVQAESAQKQYILENSGAKVVLTANKDVAQEVSAMNLSKKPTVVSLEGTGKGSFEGMLQSGNKRVLAIEPRRSEVAAMIYTSGTTAEPKGVRLTHGNLTSNVDAIRQLFPNISSKDKTLAVLPWGHAMGLNCELNVMLDRGASIILNDKKENIARNIVEQKPTMFIAVPKLLNMIYAKAVAKAKVGPVKLPFRAMVKAAARARDGKKEGYMGLGKLLRAFGEKAVFPKVREGLGENLEFMVSGSAPLAKEIYDFARIVARLEVVEGYGQTELSPIATAETRGETYQDSVGKPIPGVEVKIDVSDGIDGVEQENGVGELLVRGHNVMKGYNKLEEANKKVFTRDKDGKRWLRTGDLAYITTQKQIRIVGRVGKDQYKGPNGEKIHPVKLEDKIMLESSLNDRLIADLVITGNEKTNIALVIPSEHALKWAKSKRIINGNEPIEEQVSKLARSRTFRKKLAKDLGKSSSTVLPYERPRKFAVIPPLSEKEGTLTSVGKKRRSNIADKYDNQIKALFEMKEPKKNALPVALKAN